jgi:CHASE2 domain-containing sensor protein
MVNYPKLGDDQNGVHVSPYTAMGDAESKTESELAMQRAKLLLMQRGIDIEDPDWKTQLESIQKLI